MTNSTIYQSLEKIRLETPKNTALHYLGANISFEQVINYSCQVAGGLQSLGHKEDDVITICLPNIPQCVFAFYGTNKLGCIANMLHPLLPPKQIIKNMKHTNSKTIFMLDLVYAKNKDIFDKEELQIILCSVGEYLPFFKSFAYTISQRKHTKNLNRLPFAYFLDKKSTPTDTNLSGARVYLSSGGTTDEPKTIMLSNANFNALAQNALEIIGVSRNNHAKAVNKLGMLASLPMFHGFGLCMGVHAPLVNGMRSILIPKFDIKAITTAMRKSSISFITGVPTMYEKLLTNRSFTTSKKLPRLITAFCGGDSMPYSLKEKFEDIMTKQGSNCLMFEGYGLTETVTVCTVNTAYANKINSIGKPIRNCSVKIVDEDGKTLEPNQYGQIAVCGPTIMLGYLNDIETTAKTIVDGYVLTGDYGYMDKDGYVFFKQRLKRIIKVNGVGVFPSEIENIASELPQVKFACALPKTDEICGHVVKLYVELNEGIEKSNQTQQLITSHLQDNLIKWAIPREIQFVDNMPLTLVGKVDFKELQNLFDKN